ncbi:dTDP-4-dehydrorhamnose reductase [candidate division KSB1 bacterium]|nr:MAG: dTDP-4-dehydrorhamnose reductase [candidate division KSB1 bacterium]
MMHKILIFGSNGLLGQNLIRHFHNKHEIFGASFENENYIAEYNFPYYTVNLTDRLGVADLINDLQPTIIINAAAYTNVDGCEEDPETCWNVNVRGVENIIDACGIIKPILVHVSTDYVFDGEDGPYTEDDIPNPQGNYARSKYNAELVVSGSNLEYIIARTQVLFGAGKRVRPNFVTWVIDQLSHKKKIRIVDDQIGTPTYAPDFCEAIDRLLQKEAYGLFHVSGKDIISRYDFAVKIAEVFDLDASLIERIKTKDLNQKAPRPMNSSFKIYKLINYSGWEPHSLTKALKLLKKELQAENG